MKSARFEPGPVEALFGQCEPILLIESLQILKLLNFREFPGTFTYIMWKYIKNGVWNSLQKLRSV